VKKGDVIVGIGGKSFAGDVRQEFAAAIDQAESASAKGALPLTLKEGAEATLKLRILGSYSDTAPWNCNKTDAIVTRIADRMERTKSFAGGQVTVGWIGLLATGEKKYLDVVKEELPKQEWAQEPDPETLAALLRGDTGLIDKDLGRSLNILAPDPFAAGLVQDKDLFYQAAQMEGNV
jgi:hypothetical protein